MALQTSSVASFNELAGYFRQRQAAENGDRWYGGSWYEGGIDQWIQWPEWLNSRCDDRYSALDAGGCCRDSGNAAVRLALHLSDMAQDILAALDGGDRGCAVTETDLAPLIDAVPGVVAAIRAALVSADRVRAVQLGCALDRSAWSSGGWRPAAGARGGACSTVGRIAGRAWCRCASR